jgi:hypothetical protein
MDRRGADGADVARARGRREGLARRSGRLALRRKHWHETALWWPHTRTLVVAEALGTNAFTAGGKDAIGVHLLLRLTPPRTLGRFEPVRLLVGHGECVYGSDTPAEIRRALARSRRGLSRILVRVPFANRS